MVICDSVWVCADCMLVAVNDDSTALSDEREREVREGLRKFSHLAMNFDIENGIGHDDFSVRRCDSCGTTLFGARYRMAQIA